MSFDQLLREAEAAPFEGWDFSFLEGRVDQEGTPWRYEDTVRSRLAYPLLDMGTGGGELFGSLGPFEGSAVATEAWEPNVAVAARNLRPAQASVVQCEGAPDNDTWAGEGGDLPFRDASFALVLNRHEAYSPTEVARVLQPGATFITQQVGERNDEELARLFGGFAEPEPWGLEAWVRQLEVAGLEVVDAQEAFPTKVFRDVGAVAWYLKAIATLPPYFEGFTIDGSEEMLAAVHETIQTTGGLVVHDHRYYLEARRP